MCPLITTNILLIDSCWGMGDHCSMQAGRYQQIAASGIMYCGLIMIGYACKVHPLCMSCVYFCQVVIKEQACCYEGNRA